MTGGAVLQHRMYNLINPNLSDVTWSYSFPTSLFSLGKKGQFRISKPTLKDFTIVPLAGVQTMQAGKNVQLSSVNSTGYSSEVPQTNQPMYQLLLITSRPNILSPAPSLFLLPLSLPPLQCPGTPVICGALSRWRLSLWKEANEHGKRPTPSSKRIPTSRRGRRL